MVNFCLLAADIVSLVWGTPGNFNGFHVLATLLHATLVVGISQTLRRWTEGATYMWQGGHHVGHSPTFYFLLSFNGVISTTAWISWHENVYANIYFNKTGCYALALALAGLHTNHLDILLTDNHGTTSSSIFCVRWSCWCQSNSLKSLKAVSIC